MFGDSGSSTASVAMRLLDLAGQHVLDDQRALLFSLRTKYARRSPTGDHDIHGTMFHVRSACAMYSKPRSLSKPGVRLRTT